MQNMNLDDCRVVAHALVESGERNRIRHICVDGNGQPERATHSPTDFETDLAYYFLAAHNAGLIKVKRHGA